MTNTPSIVLTRREVTICLIAAGILITALVLALRGGASAPAPITPALLEKAAQAAEATGGGYDYSCQLYAAPRQILCQGQGDSVGFLVTPTGQLQTEPGPG